jgi:hypothetical protein
MPLAATITAFYNFSANTKARASQVNANFDVFRGHIIPIDPNTITAIGNTYDLGSAEYYWRAGYIGKLYLGATTASWSLLDATTTTNNYLGIYQNSTLKYAINKNVGPTTTADYGQKAYSSVFDAGPYDVAGHVVGSTCSVKTVGRTVEVSLLSANTTTASLVNIQQLTSTAFGNVTCEIRFYKNGAYQSSQYAGGIISGLFNGDGLFVPSSTFKFYDFNPGNTTNIYSFYVAPGGGTRVSLTAIRSLAEEK